MSQICRTCLQKTNATFKTSHSLGDYEEGSVMIGKALKYCIKDLYLGLSINTDICLDCKEKLKITYEFIKNCAKTDQIILNFLKNARCTGKSVDLHDVVSHLNREKNSIAEGMLRLNKTTASDINLRTENFKTLFEQNIVAEASGLLEIRQSAPNSTPPTTNKSFKGILNEYGKVTNASEIIKKLQTSEAERTKTVLRVKSIEFPKQTVPNTSDNFCKISSVFSLKDNLENDKTNGDASSSEKGEREQNVDDILNIKQEPTDIDITDDPLNFNFTQTDEDTLDATETTFFENNCSNLQSLVDSIPEIHHPDQYIDIPDFVTINNFGFKELEELKLKQQIDNNVNNVSNSVPDTSNNLVLKPTNISSNQMYQGLKVVNFVSNLPDVLILENGQRMVKCGNGYKIENAQEGCSNGSLETTNEPKDKEGTVLASSIRKRYRKKIKIVPVNDQQPPEKKAKTETTDSENLKYKYILPKGLPQKDIVVLYTTYSTDGYYINDHDYLISPYKRNKILLVENNIRKCMCYICNTMHSINSHVDHMNTHKSFCKLCNMDYNNPYTYNIHYKSHKRVCHVCTAFVPYYEFAEHEQTHIREDGSMPEEAKVKSYSARKGRRKIVKDEEAVQSPKPKPEEDADESKESNQNENKETESEKRLEDAPIDSVPETPTKAVRSYRGRRGSRGKSIRKTDGGNVSKVIYTARVLRTRTKKLYAESDEEDDSAKRNNFESSTGMATNIKEEK